MTSPRSILERLQSPAEVRTVVQASPAEVYAVLSDPTTYPEWLTGAQRIRRVDPDFPREGSTFGHEVGPAAAATVADESESLVDDPPHHLRLAVHAGPLAGIADFRLRATGEGTEVVFQETITGALAYAMPALRPLLHARNRAALSRLRGRLAPLIITLR
jgi:uncharacterized protein YndB with AHSA1/START domain